MADHQEGAMNAPPCIVYVWRGEGSAPARTGQGLVIPSEAIARSFGVFGSLLVGCIGLVPRLWPVALRSPHIIVQTSIVLASAVMLRSTGAKMRALCARQLMPAAKGKKL